MSKKESERFLSSCFHVRGVNKHASRYWARLGLRRCSSRALETAVRSRRAETAPSGQMSLYVVSGCLVGTGNRRDTDNCGVHRGQAWNRIDRYARARHESFRQKGVEMENEPTSGRFFIKKRTALFSATFNRATTAKRSGKMIEVLSLSFSLFLLDDGLNDDVPGNRRRESKNSDAGHRNGGTRLYYGVWSKTAGPSHRQFLTVICKNQPSRPIFFHQNRSKTTRHPVYSFLCICNDPRDRSNSYSDPRGDIARKPHRSIDSTFDAAVNFTNMKLTFDLCHVSKDKSYFCKSI